MSGYLLDTNLVSEWSKPQPNSGVVEWFRSADEGLVHLSAVTLAELWRGIVRLPDSVRRRQLHSWFESEVRLRFLSRVLDVDEAVALCWGEIVSHRERIGRPMPTLDAFIAATAAAHDLTLVTRNVADFADTGIEILNPWTD